MTEPDIDALLNQLDQVQVRPAALLPSEQARMDRLLRELGDEPLVRKHHRLDEGWSWLCPAPACQVWRVGYDSPAACRVGWFAHCTDPAAVDNHGPYFVPSWPQDMPCEVTQPVTRPDRHGNYVLVFLDLIRRGEAVDRMGRPLTFGVCMPCGEPTYPYTPHLEISGRTCVEQVPCPKCGVGPGVHCDRSRPEWTVVDYGQHQRMTSGHTERFEAAVAEEERRWAAGDMTLPAGWRPEPAPSKQPKAAKPHAWKVTLEVAAPSGYSDLWKEMVYEYVALRRLWWTQDMEVAHIMFEDRKTAEMIVQLVVAFYGIPAGRVRVVDGVDPDRVPDFAARVQADALQVIKSWTPAMPEPHLAWALGAYQIRSVSPFLDGVLSLPVLRDLYADHTLALPGAVRVSTTHRKVDAGVRPPVVVPWSAAAKIVGCVDPGLVAEMRVASAEAAAVPRRTVEFECADLWSAELAARAWQACRPAGLPPFTGRAKTETQPPIE